MFSGRMRPLRVGGGRGSLGANEADLGGRGNAFFGSTALPCVGEKVATDELFPVASPPPSDDLISDSPELLEYAESKLEIDPDGEAGSASI